MSPAPREAPPLGLYLHWPFCGRVCPYCDFVVVRDRNSPGRGPRLARALLEDLEAHAALLGRRRLVSIFFGGGTPSRMDPAEVERLIRRALDLFAPAEAVEITVESNPADHARFADFAAAGVNRISLGVQSLDDAALRFLGRDHDQAMARAAAAAARRAVPRLSLDLIYALPGQDPAAWRADLQSALALEPEHVSAYQLSIEPGAAFARAVRRGRLSPLPDEEAADLYQLTQETLSAAGLDAYEVSNHACGEAARSRHNLLYWGGGDWAGLGPGAHGRLTLGAERTSTLAPATIETYVRRVETAGLGCELEPLAARDAALERLALGLRVSEGVSLAELAPLDLRRDRLETLAPFVSLRNGRLAATPAGRPVLDRVAAELIA